MKNIFNSRYIVVIFPIVQILITLFVYNQLPNDLPMQVSMSGEVNWTLPKIFGAWLLPAVSAAVMLYNVYFKPSISKGNLWFYGILLFGINMCALYIAL